MYNRNYSKEVGLDSGEKIVPWRYLIPAVALLAALCWIAFVALDGRQDARRAATEQSQPASRL
jgi:hypothetical protein